MIARRRIQIASVGFDDYRQLYGGDPFGNASNVGLRIPLWAQPVGKSNLRYLFCLCAYQVPAGVCVRVKGFRQLATIGVALESDAQAQGPFVYEQPIVTPTWSFGDGNISWHLMTFTNGAVPDTVAGPLDALSFVYRWRPGPALLYKSATFPAANIKPNGHPDSYLALTGYVPPNNGIPYGEPLTPDLGTFYDLRNPWDGRTADMLDVPVRGPRTIAFFASVLQSAGFPSDAGTPNRPYPARPPWPTVVQVYPPGLTPEESAVQTFQFEATRVYLNYWRVGGEMTIEDEG